MYKPYKSCIVVGSGDMVQPRGHLINTYETIFRMNDAPTIGFEDLVGNRTTIRLINKLSILTWLGLKNHTLYVHKNANRFDPNLCYFPTQCILTDTWKNAIAYVEMAKKRYPKLNLQIDTRPRKHAQLALRRQVVSQGFVAANLAKTLCHTTTLVNYDPFCCKSSRNYKYYHTNASKFVCCSKGREPFELEFAYAKRRMRVLE